MFFSSHDSTNNQYRSNENQLNHCQSNSSSEIPIGKFEISKNNSLSLNGSTSNNFPYQFKDSLIHGIPSCHSNHQFWASSGIISPKLPNLDTSKPVSDSQTLEHHNDNQGVASNPLLSRNVSNLPIISSGSSKTSSFFHQQSGNLTSFVNSVSTTPERLTNHEKMPKIIEPTFPFDKKMGKTANISNSLNTNYSSENAYDLRHMKNSENIDFNSGSSYTRLFSTSHGVPYVNSCVPKVAQNFKSSNVSNSSLHYNSPLVDYQSRQAISSTTMNECHLTNSSMPIENGPPGSLQGHFASDQDHHKLRPGGPNFSSSLPIREPYFSSNTSSTEDLSCLYKPSNYSTTSCNDNLPTGTSLSSIDLLFTDHSKVSSHSYPVGMQSPNPWSPNYFSECSPQKVSSYSPSDFTTSISSMSASTPMSLSMNNSLASNSTSSLSHQNMSKDSGYSNLQLFKREVESAKQRVPSVKATLISNEAFSNDFDKYPQTGTTKPKICSVVSNNTTSNSGSNLRNVRLNSIGAKSQGKKKLQNRFSSSVSREPTVQVVGIEDLGINVEGNKKISLRIQTKPKSNKKSTEDKQNSRLFVPSNDDSADFISAKKISNDSIEALNVQTHSKTVFKSHVPRMVVCQHCGISEEWTTKFCSRCKQNIHKKVIKSILKRPSLSFEVPNCKKIEDYKSTSSTSLSQENVSTKTENTSNSLKTSIASKLEPEILILSSDEEENVEAEETESSKMETKESCLSGGGKPDDLEKAISENWFDEFVFLPAKMISIGTYSTLPINRVFFCEKGIAFTVLSDAEESKSETVVRIQSNFMAKIIANFDSTDPVVFILLRQSYSKNIKELLRFSNHSYNPNSSQTCEQMIIIQLEEVSESDRETFVGFYKNSKNFLFLVDEEESKSLLFKYSMQSEDSKVFTKLKTQTLLIYPPQKNSGGITITTDDYYCLEEEQFLNDVILDFYLKYLFVDVLSDADRDRTHIFSTFFYKRLTSKPKKKSESFCGLSPAQNRHLRVKSWTKNIDIFQKDFIIVPINDRSHWFLAVICFPGLIEDYSKLQKSITKKIKRPKDEHKVQIPLISDLEWSDKDEAESDEDEIESEEEVTEPLAKKHKGPPIKQPCILIFDSLSGAPRSRIVATLRDYLNIEFWEKRNINEAFTKDTMKGTCPIVPQQTNFSDCGIFTLQFVESFFERPIKDFRFPIKNLLNWFTQDQVERKREDIANLIKSLMDKYRPNHGIELPLLLFNSQLKAHETESLPNGQACSSFSELLSNEEGSSSFSEFVPNGEGCSSFYKEHPNEVSKEPKEIIHKIHLTDEVVKKPCKEVILEDSPSEKIVTQEPKKIKVTLLNNRPKKVLIPRPTTPLPFLRDNTAIDELYLDSHLQQAIRSNSITVTPVNNVKEPEEVLSDECNREEDEVIFENAFFKPTFGASRKSQVINELPDDDDDDVLEVSPDTLNNSTINRR